MNIEVIFQNSTLEGTVVLHLKDNKTISVLVIEGIGLIKKTDDICANSTELRFHLTNPQNYVSWEAQDICAYNILHLKGEIYQTLLDRQAIIEEQSKKNKVTFLFTDKTTNCSLKGKVSLNNNLIGLADKDFNFKKDKYFEFKNNGENELCIQGTLSSCFEQYKFMKYYNCWDLDFDEKMFEDNTRYTINYKARINPHRPYNFAKTFFITPDEVKSYLPLKYLKNNTEEDLDYIQNFANNHVRYRHDFIVENDAEHWEFPLQTLKNFYGDCEEVSTVVVSLMKAYNESQKCYVFLLPSHASTFCKINGNKYIIYDQSLKEDRTIADSLNEYDKIKALRNFFNSYFEEFGLTSQSHFINAIFDNKEYREFNSNDEFYEWLLEL